MAHSRTAQHPNAALTPRMRRKMVDLVVAQGWPAAPLAALPLLDVPPGMPSAARLARNAAAFACHAAISPTHH